MDSNHALAREVRFSFLLFGFELLRGLHLDLFCEHIVRQALYSVAFDWFSSRPQYVWVSFFSGSFQTQLRVDGHMVPTEFRLMRMSRFSPSFYHIFKPTPFAAILRYLVWRRLRQPLRRLVSLVLSFTLGTRADSFAATLLNNLKVINQLLRFLVEDEIYRLTVWSNPMNDPKRGVDHVGSTERGMADVSLIMGPPIPHTPLKLCLGGLDFSCSRSMEYQPRYCSLSY
jgi:phosphatidylinositol 4-kinase A